MKSRAPIGMMKAGLLVALGMITTVGCGGAAKPATLGPSGAPASSDDAGSPAAGNATAEKGPDAPARGAAADADKSGAPPAGKSDAAAAAASPPERPFAKTPEQATALIDDAVGSRTAPLSRCVEDARTRAKNAHAKITVEIGIDQEGHLLGVKTPKGRTSDTAFNACVQSALQGAPFPRSHAGVITITKTFEDSAVYR